jgi:ribosome-binding ATPase YchF (GTP1/OBG family)
MFSGYGQTQSMTRNVFSALENFLADELQRDRALDHIDEWDQGDVHRLVSAFLGVRFPMALALNKCDLPSSLKHAERILLKLPIHGAHVGTPMTAKNEMGFVRDHLTNETSEEATIPTGVWTCLTSAMMLREPILVFPVSDMVTYAPMPGLNRAAAESPSLPSPGIITCIKAAGGSAPTCWEDKQEKYLPANKNQNKDQSSMLRDVVLVKPGSTVEDVFLTLKRMGALGGEFVRAEGAGDIGEKPKLVPKHEQIGKHNRILKIMSNKRTAWQNH